jgi:pseudouridine-5'-phosphate glycosidase
MIKLSAEVEAAINEKRAVVALESTVVAHGLPRPENLRAAQRLEEVVREGGATPATVAILRGQLRVGLDADELRHLAESEGILKVSRRDLPVVVARNLDGATTVATTLWIAERAGVRVFATGGIGGVHRGALPDISADLPELARASGMTVVCSGAKIVLDLAATREWLETHGITVIGYGCDELPAFYSRRSGLRVDVRADSAEEVAQIIAARRRLMLEGATLLAVPVPEEAEVPAQLLQEALQEALAEAEQKEIGGRELTPFLLSRMAASSGGATLQANIALLANNARVAAEVAKALSSST